MNKKELISAIATATGLPRSRAAKVLEAILGNITEALARGETVTIPVFGVFRATARAARAGRNPMTGQQIQVASRRVPAFKPVKRLKEAVNAVEGARQRARSFHGVTAGMDGLRESAIDSADEAAGSLVGEPALTSNAGEVFVPVHYATNREASGETDPNEFYDAERSAQLHYGRLVVSIPARHKIGQVERPTVWRLWRESPARHVVLREIDVLNEAAFFQSLAGEVARIEERTAFVFIHGFNVTFASAAHRAAQMAYDLFLVGEEQHQAVMSVVPILFSWPSKGEVIPYTHDATNAEVSAGHFKSFLKDVAQRSGAKSLVLIAHSMGNRVLTTALKEIGLAMQEGDGPLVREIILAAPDIDKDVFRQAAAALMRTCGRVTLYASDRDKALKASLTVNGHPRAGDATGGVLTIGGMDSIDASAAGEDFLAHSYVGETSVLNDLYAIIMRGDPPGSRFGLVAQGVSPDRFWRMRGRA